MASFTTRSRSLVSSIRRVSFFKSEDKFLQTYSGTSKVGENSLPIRISSGSLRRVRFILRLQSFTFTNSTFIHAFKPLPMQRNTRLNMEPGSTVSCVSRDLERFQCHWPSCPSIRHTARRAGVPIFSATGKAISSASAFSATALRIAAFACRSACCYLYQSDSRYFASLAAAFSGANTSVRHRPHRLRPLWRTVREAEWQSEQTVMAWIPISVSRFALLALQSSPVHGSTRLS